MYYFTLSMVFYIYALEFMVFVVAKNWMISKTNILSYCSVLY